jgi:hypothetical protein
MVDITRALSLFDPIGAYQEGRKVRKEWDQEAALKDTFSNMPKTTDGRPDYMTAAQKLFAAGATGPGMGLAQLAMAQADKETARSQWQQSFGLQQQQFAQSKANADRDFSLRQRTSDRADLNTYEGREAAAQKAGLRQGTPEYNQFVLGGRMPGNKDLSSTEMKMVAEADDEAKAIEGSIPMLREALDLSKKAFYGPGAGIRATIGTQFPNVAKADPTGVLDPEGARATARFQQIMTPEALTAMSQTLKGVTTDFEFRQFVSMMADPSVAPDLKEAKLNDLLRKANSRIEFLRRQSAEVRGKTYFKPGEQQPGAPASAPAAPGQSAPQAPAGQPARIADKAQYDALPSGAQYVAPDGSLRTKR